jgi:ribonuclease BN (tRNA processing enzyme)
MARPLAAPTGESGLSLLVLGCDGSWPGPGGAGSGYLVRSATTSLLVDAGPGTFANLQRFVDPGSIDGVILSHSHPDHWTDIYGFDLFARYVTDRSDIPVFAPDGLEQRVALSGSSALTWHRIQGGDRLTVGDLGCSFVRTDHGPETLAVRIEGGGRTLGYSADSGPNWSLGELGHDLDLILCEATFTSEHEGVAGHMSARQAVMQARSAGARRIVLTHRWPTVDASAVADEAAESSGEPVEQAEIGKEFQL